MNFKKMAKRFWTLSKHHEGFTLVELIVVIAIMAILAGVAVPAYTGYINKANKASDLQLLGAINTAFGAAALENNANVNDPASLGATPKITLTDGKVATINLFEAEFFKYYAGNTGSEFKVITELIFENGVFKDKNDVATVPIDYNGITINVPQSQVNAVVNSTFGSLGANSLLNKVDSVANVADGMMGTAGAAFDDLLMSEGFMKDLSGSLGVTAEFGTEEWDTQFTAKLDTMAQDMVDKGLATDLNDANNQIMVNNAVLYASQNATNMSKNDINSMFASDTAKSNIVNALTAEGGNKAEGLAQAALAYGMYTAYANQTGNESLLANADDPLTVLNSLNDTGFKNYVASEQGQKDLDGYLAALEMVNSSTNDPATTESILTNGFTDPDLIKALEGIIG